jgi:tRNA nucleotidyltransferase (CCA-adding enzyme)
MKLKGLHFPQKKLFTGIFKDKVYLVGGAIRDHMLYNSIDKRQDIDLLVEGHTYEEIEKKLKRYGKTNTVGKSFAVVKFSRGNKTVDVAMPRKDVKRDPDTHGHKNFVIECGPHIPLEEDLKRRDFTCNSMAMRLQDNELVDPFDGAGAIKNRQVVMTGPETFVDDPLRILRAARFASVHGFTVDQKIYECSKEVPLDQLSVERTSEEWLRLLLESERPSVGMGEYLKLTVLEKLFPLFYPLTLTIQDAIFHPEKDEYGHHTVWFHVMVTLDIAKKISVMYELSEEQTLALLLGVLFHDVGKAETTKWEFKRGRMTVTSIFHDSVGVGMTEPFLTDMKIGLRKNYPVRQMVLNMVKWHHRIYELYRNRDDTGFKAFSRLVRDMEGEDLLLALLDFADRQSREPDPLAFDDVDGITQWYFRRKEELKVNKEIIEPIIMGRDLIKVGIKPGVQMGEYLRQLFELQLDGEFETKEQGLERFERIRENGF